MVLTDESGATPTTEYSLIAAGLAFGVIVATLPPSMTFARPTAALVLLLAWAAAALWLKMGTGRLGLANAMPATVHSNSRPQSAGSVNHRTSAA
jgi:hypothetical protein